MDDTPSDGPKRATQAQLATRRIRDVQSRRRTAAPRSAGSPPFVSFNSSDTNDFAFIPVPQPPNQSVFAQPQSSSGASQVTDQSSQNESTPFGFGAGSCASSSMFDFKVSPAADESSSRNPSLFSFPARTSQAQPFASTSSAPAQSTSKDKEVIPTGNPSPITQPTARPAERLGDLRPQNFPAELKKKTEDDTEFFSGAIHGLNERLKRRINELDLSKDDVYSAVLAYLRVRETIEASIGPGKKDTNAKDNEGSDDASSNDNDAQAAKKTDSDVPGPDNNHPSVNGTPGEDGAVAAPPASTTSPGRVLQ